MKNNLLLQSVEVLFYVIGFEIFLPAIIVVQHLKWFVFLIIKIFILLSSLRQ